MLKTMVVPARYAARENLLDGRPVLIRAIRPDDKEGLQAGMRRLSPESSYNRFMQAKRRLTEEELRYYTEVDFTTHVGLVAVVWEDGADLLVATARYVVDPAGAPRTAEVAFTVDNAHQGLGIATLFLKHLAVIARASGIARFRASVLAENRRMLDVFAHSGFPMTVEPDGGTVECRLSLQAEVQR
jgi:GNAT superfamily N-acetyltransferase